MTTLVDELKTDQPCSTELSIANAITHPNPTTQLLLTSKLGIHIPEAGLNPLVDAASHLFSTMGKLKRLRTAPDLQALHDELVQEVTQFQTIIESYNYNDDYIAEYMPITCYALCVALDDTIANTTWGNQGQWDKYNIVSKFIPEPPSHVSFFIILERLIRDPSIYIDIMEFMYICLSLGFKCGYNANTAEFDYAQFEQISNSLYKRIRAHRGNFNKSLSPFPIKPAPNIINPSNNSMPIWATIMLITGLSIVFFISGTYLLEYFLHH